MLGLGLGLNTRRQVQGEAYITDNLVSHWELRFTADVTESGGGIQGWADHEGSNDLAQGILANEPAYTASDATLNNLPTISGNGTGDFISIAPASFTGTAYTIYTIFKVSAFPGATAVIYNIDGTGTSELQVWTGGYVINKFGSGFNSGQINISTGVWYLAITTVDAGGNYHFEIAGLTPSTGTTTAQMPSKFSFLSRTNGAFSMSGSVYGAMLYNAAHDATQISQMKSYFTSITGGVV